MVSKRSVKHPLPSNSTIILKKIRYIKLVNMTQFLYRRNRLSKKDSIYPLNMIK